MTGEADINPSSLGHALRVVTHFVGHAFRKFPGSFVAVPVLSLAALFFQSGLVLVMLTLIARIAPEAAGDQSAVAGRLAAYLGTLSTSELGILACLCVSAVPLVRFASQMVTVRLGTRIFRTNMALLTDRLVEMREREALLYNTSAALAGSAYTNGCRYAGVISARSVGAVFHLLSVPVFLAICLYLSPGLTGLFALIVVLALPFHLMLMRRGITSTREMLAAAAQHRSSKSDALKILTETDPAMPIDTVRLHKEHVEDGSRAFLQHFERRRALAAYSSLVSGISLVAVIILLVLSLSGVLPGVAPAIDRLVAFAVAIRFLGESGSSLASFITTTVSVTPLLEQLHGLLTRDIRVPPPMAGTREFAGALGRRHPQGAPGVVPDHLVVSAVRLDRHLLNRLLPGMTGVNGDVPLLEGRLPAQTNALSPDVNGKDAARLAAHIVELAPAAIGESAQQILAGQFTGTTPADRAMRIKVALFADLARIAETKPELLFVSSLVTGQLARIEWQAFCDFITMRGIETVMVMNSAPKRLPADFNPGSLWLATFGEIRRLENRELDVVTLGALIDEAVRTDQQPVPADTPLSDMEEL